LATVIVPLKWWNAGSEQDLGSQVVADAVKILLIQQHLAHRPAEYTRLLTAAKALN
jgi:hypothetical protein